MEGPADGTRASSNPLGGGFFTGRYRDLNSQNEPGSRFDPNTAQGKMYRQRYWNEQYFQALEIVEKAAKEAGLTLGECALRWMSHHSQMKKEHGDSVIIGASSVKHLEENLNDLEKGPLPDSIVEAMDQAWKTVAADNVKYWH
jgi:aflatoxin B1 aldehyde reductase